MQKIECHVPWEKDPACERIRKLHSSFTRTFLLSPSKRIKPKFPCVWEMSPLLGRPQCGIFKFFPHRPSVTPCGFDNQSSSPLRDALSPSCLSETFFVETSIVVIKTALNSRKTRVMGQGFFLLVSRLLFNEPT